MVEWTRGTAAACYLPVFYFPNTVLTCVDSPAVETFMIDNAAHHLDLFFSNARDPSSVVRCRELEVSFIKKWIAAAERKRMNPEL